MLFPLKLALFLREIALFYTNSIYKFSYLWSKVEGHKINGTALKKSVWNSFHYIRFEFLLDCIFFCDNFCRQSWMQWRITPVKRWGSMTWLKRFDCVAPTQEVQAPGLQLQPDHQFAVWWVNSGLITHIFSVVSFEHNWVRFRCLGPWCKLTKVSVGKEEAE